MSIDPDLLEDDLVSSAVVKLRNALTTAGLVGTLVGKDPSPSDAWYTGWVFSGSDYENAPSRDVTSTGKAGLVVSSSTHWASNNHNTARFPVLQVLIFADSSRIPNSKSKAAEDADLKVNKVAKVVRACFHDPANRKHEWPLGFRVHSSLADGDLSITAVPGSDGISRGLQRFNVVVADELWFDAETV